MRGTLVSKVWEWDPTLYAPPRYRKACKCESFIPERLSGFEFGLTSGIAGVVSDAEQAINDPQRERPARPRAPGSPATPH